MIQREFPIQEIPIYNISRIPTDSQIISISAFKSNYDKNKIVLGVTITQPINVTSSDLNEQQKRKYIDDDESSTDHEYSSSYDSGGGGDSTDDDSIEINIHSTKKKKKKINSMSGNSFISHSKITNTEQQHEDNEQQNQQNQQQYNNYFYIYLLDIDEIINNNQSIKFNQLLYNNNSTPTTKHKCIQTFSLGYVPLKITTQTTTLYPNLQKYSIFVICGSDKNFHCFSDIILTPQNNSIMLKLFDIPLYNRNIEYTNSIRHYYNRYNENLFIEYDFIIPGGVPGSVVDLDSISNNLIVMGCQNGFVKICKNPSLEMQFMLNSPIGSIKILNYTNSELSLLIGESIGRVVLYNIPLLTTSVKHDLSMPSTPSSILASNITNANNLNNFTPISNIQSTIIYSDDFGDSITCLYPLHYKCGITDIYIGTYNRKLIVYQYESSSNTCIYKCTYHFEYPIQCIDSIDINNDGIKEIIICTMFEIQILQPDLSSIAKYLKEKLTEELESKTREE